MNEEKRNIIGDFIISSVIGCATVLGLLFISFTFFSACAILLSIFK